MTLILLPKRCYGQTIKRQHCLILLTGGLENAGNHVGIQQNLKIKKSEDLKICFREITLILA